MNKKKPPVSRGTYGAALRVVDADGARRNSLALKQADALPPSAPPMPTKGKNLNPKQIDRREDCLNASSRCRFLSGA